MSQYDFSADLIKRYKEIKGFKTDSELANTLPAMKQPNVSQIKSGERPLTPEQAMAIAESCGMDIGEVLVRLDMEKTKSPAVKAELQKVLKRLAGVFAALVLTLNLASTPSQSDAVTPA